MDAFADMLPWWLALGLIALSYVVARKFNLGPGAKPLLSALRAALWLKVRRDRPKLRLVVTPQPPPVSDGGIAEDRELPPAQLVDSQGNPVGHGPPPENESGSGG